MAAARALQVSQDLADCRWIDNHLVWYPQGAGFEERSRALQTLLLQHRKQGLVTGWRDECFSFWNAGFDSPDAQVLAYLSVERAGFRYLGMMSHAVHINGFLPDGRLWCGRRSRHKATDPGLLDNLAAGGLPTGESILACAQRELYEEAGVSAIAEGALVRMGFVRTSRPEPEGWHDEILHVCNLELEPNFAPANQDGEVDEFVCLYPPEVLERIRQGAFTVDAAVALAQGLF